MHQDNQDNSIVNTTSISNEGIVEKTAVVEVSEKNTSTIKMNNVQCEFYELQKDEDKNKIVSYPKFIPDDGDEEFIKEFYDKDEGTIRDYRRQFWNVGNDVMAKTASKSFNLKPDDSQVFRTKTMINVMHGSIKITYNARLPVVSKIAKVFEGSPSHTICVEACKDRAITVSQAVGVDTAIVKFDPAKHGGEITSEAISALAPFAERELMSVVRIGWLKDEYAED